MRWSGVNFYFRIDVCATVVELLHSLEVAAVRIIQLPFAVCDTDIR